MVLPNEQVLYSDELLLDPVNEQIPHLRARPAAMLFALTSQGLCTAVNRAWSDFTGADQATSAGEGWRQHVHPDDISGFIAAWRECGLERREVTMPLRLRRGDGEFSRCSVSAIPIPGVSGEIDCWSFSAVEELADSTDFSALTAHGDFREALQAARMGTWLWSVPEQTVTWVGYGWSKFHAGLGVYRSTVQALHEMVADSGAATLRKSMKSTVEFGTPFHAQIQITTPDGEMRWMEMYGLPDDDSSVKEVRGVFRDVTRRKHLQKKAHALHHELRENYDRFHAVIQHMADGVAICDLKTNQVFFNTRYKELLGIECGLEPPIVFDPAAVYYELQTLDLQPVPVEQRPMARAIAGETFSSQELIVTHEGDMRAVVCSFSGAMIADSRRSAGLAVITVRDVTESKQLEADLQAAFAREHKIADSLQRSLLLVPTETGMTGVRVSNRYKAASSEAAVGGDFHDTFVINDDELALIIGDVSGKGLSAAIRTAELKYSIRALLREYPNPARALERLNSLIFDQQIYDSAFAETMVSISIALVNTKTGRLDLAVSGMDQPILMSADGGAQQIADVSLPVGVYRQMEVTPTRLQMASGDIMVMFTDGITEARRDGALYGTERIIASALKARQSNSLDQLIEHMLLDAKCFAGGDLQDDLCLLALQKE